MHAAWYERRGPARAVLTTGDHADAEAGPGEVRLRVAYSGISPGDVKKRAGWMGAPMPYPLVIPHSDGSGIIDSVGVGVASSLIGRQAWCFGAQSYRPFGTAAEFVVVPANHVSVLPESGTTVALLTQAASLGISGITGHRALFTDGPVDGLTVLIYGAGKGVGLIASQLARANGAFTIAVVRRRADVEVLASLGIEHIIVGTGNEVVDQVRLLAPEGPHRIVDVDFSDHIDQNAEMIAVGGTISAYYSSEHHPAIPYWELGFKDVALRLLGSDDFSISAKREAADELTARLMAGELQLPTAEVFSLEDIASAHELVENGAPGKVVLSLPAK